MTLNAGRVVCLAGFLEVANTFSMSSARMLLAAVAIGLAACAHTPTAGSSFYLPDIRNAAPVLMVSGEEVPDGFDDHVVIIVDYEGIERAYRTGRLDRHGRTLYYDVMSSYAYRVPYARPPFHR